MEKYLKSVQGNAKNYEAKSVWKNFIGTLKWTTIFIWLNKYFYNIISF